MINILKRKAYLVNPYTNEIIDRSGKLHNITEEMFEQGWVRVWWCDNQCEMESLKIENIQKAFDQLINNNILSDYKNFHFRFLYKLEDEQYQMFLDGSILNDSEIFN